MRIYTDGSCRNNGKEGAQAAWAFSAVDENNKEVFFNSGAIANGTNNIGEMTAIVRAMEWAKENNFKDITIITDSAYCLNGITEWIINWKKFDWYRDAKRTKVIKNLELWKDIDHYNNVLSITWEKVKGHSGDKWNERADQLAQSTY